MVAESPDPNSALTPRPREGAVDACPLAELFESLPEPLRHRAVAHSSWVDSRPDSYGRLAFLGDAVLGLVLAQQLFNDDPEADIGDLTKVHGQAVSGRACVEVGEALGLAKLIVAAQPPQLDGGISAAELLLSERAVSSVTEAVIGACYIEYGLDRTAAAVRSAFAPQVEFASEHLLDYKSALQERLARDGQLVSYRVVGESGPPHDRTFAIEAMNASDAIGAGSGRSKKAAEQDAAAAALRRLAASG